MNTKRDRFVTHPFQLEKANPDTDTQGRSVRLATQRQWNDSAKYKASEMSCSRDCAKLWNDVPLQIKSAKTLSCAKREIKKYFKTLVQ